MTHKGLTDKQLNFVKEYVKHGHQAKAAYTAGYGKNENSAGAMASRMMKEEKILKAIDRLRGEIETAVVKGPTQFTIEDVKEVVIERNDLTYRAIETYEDAKRDRQHGVRIQALRFLAELHDMVVKDVNTVNNNFTLNLLDDDRKPRTKTINGTVSAET